MSVADTAIYARNLVREYASDRGVCGVDLDVQWGECFALLGRNGSGKSTLSRLLIGMEKPDSGELSVAGTSLLSLNGRQRVAHLRNLGIALDTSIHWSKLPGFSNAWFVAGSYGMSSEDMERKLNNLMDEAALSDQKGDNVSSYSFGMRRKLSIVEAICHDPRILVLDEPTSGVDVHFSDRLAEIIRERSSRNLTTWIASNDPEWVAEAATRVAFMDKGRMIASGTVAELLAEVAPYQEIKITLVAEESIPPFDDPGIRSFDRSETGITVLAEEDPMLIPRLMEWIVVRGGKIESVQVRRSTLRDVFLLKTGEDLDT